MRIRLATSEDVPGIAAIYNHEILHGVATFDTVPWDDDAAHEWFGKHQDPRRPATVAIDDGGACPRLGLALGVVLTLRYARAAEDSFYVHPDHRGRGIGRAIMADLIGRAGAQGIAVLLARIETSCAASLRVHREFGFESIGTMRRVGEKFGRVLDVELMQRSLEDA